MKYRLRSQHFIHGALLEAGTVIGDGTPYPFADKPSTEMEGLDRASKEAVKHVHWDAYGKHPPWHTDDEPEEVHHRVIHSVKKTRRKRR